MPHQRAGLLFFACTVLWFVSTTSGLAHSSAEYPNATEGLQNLMNDILSATRRGDREKVGELMKQTEFADYAHYFASTYSPDPVVARDWATTYQRWLGENEDHLRELLETLAKDDDGKILVRKANDDPAPGRGFEWGLLHYARVPIDVYRVTLVFPHLPDGPAESLGYFVYADGMFRWDSIVPFAVPGTYQSDPGRLNTSQTQATGLAQYPNTPDGLREFLSELRAAAKVGDQAKVDSLIKQTEIPDYRNWFCSVYVPGSGLSWAIPYGNNLAQSEQAFKALWEKLAQNDGEIRVQWRVIHTRTSLDLYRADWKSKTGAPDEWIGQFYYIDGMFRWDGIDRSVHYPTTVVSSANMPHRGSPSAGGIFHVGGGVSPPRQIYAPQPEYSEEAREAKLEGTCVLGLIVGVDGKVSYIKVLKPLGKGLYEKAIDAGNTWKFEPAMKDGHPVPVEIAVEVDFHLK